MVRSNADNCKHSCTNHNPDKRFQNRCKRDTEQRSKAIVPDSTLARCFFSEECTVSARAQSE